MHLAVEFRRHHDDPDRRIEAPDPSQRIETAEPRHLQVEHDDLGPRALDVKQDLETVRGLEYVEAVQCKTLGERFPKVGLIVADDGNRPGAVSGQG